MKEKKFEITKIYHQDKIIDIEPLNDYICTHIDKNTINGGFMNMLNIGDTLIANHSTGFPDHITEGKEYTVVTYDNLIHTFKIINDKGKICLPTSTSFAKKN
ncbi:hypothetical protein [Lysinibacillus fusiformis]|uniref:hypothetical protein n=1 Tax=Lysinibacillus fusiformis TaxID=28031 RepID=UPI00263B36F3|nr:hypothetical protein [Lysinibacillus fusiformis]MDC6267308.1 hypothetical protein [Lysinibacillus sphaericus]MDN4968258.1 hypothetical protein [Lysinibacillus fusiformis]MDN4968432.1 hypothetical protein [Lysinibacillus fusiformis]